MSTVLPAPSQGHVSTRRQLQRDLVNRLAVIFACTAAVFGLGFLAWILWTTIQHGIGALSLSLFTEMTPAPMQEGGLANALFGSALMCGLAILIATPLGIAAGTWLAECSGARRLGQVVRFVNDILLAAPSIVIGLFLYSLVVAQMGVGFSAIAGALALAFIALPVIVRTTDEMLRLVPAQMREAALSLGIPQWRMTLQVLYRSASSGIVTGVLLALARISGETAPLLFTSFGNQFWSTDLGKPIASVPVVMNQFAASPYASWQGLAWAGALVLAAFVLALSLIARAILARTRTHHD